MAFTHAILVKTKRTNPEAHLFFQSKIKKKTHYCALWILIDCSVPSFCWITGGTGDSWPSFQDKSVFAHIAIIRIFCNISHIIQLKLKKIPFCIAYPIRRVFSYEFIVRVF